jgi:hypothetical protein
LRRQPGRQGGRGGRTGWRDDLVAIGGGGECQVPIWAGTYLVPLQGYRAQSQQPESLEAAALTLEAWLQQALSLGRKDEFLLAASSAIDVLRFRRNVQVLPLAHAWATLPQVPGTGTGEALLQSSLADVL